MDADAITSSHSGQVARQARGGSVRRSGTRAPGFAVRATFWVCQKFAARPRTSVKTH